MILLVFLSASTGLLLGLPKRENGTPLPSTQPLAPSPRGPAWIPPLPALTTYRAHMMLMTVLSILAVDFPIFPRSLVKCETFGVSLVWTLLEPWPFLRVDIGNLDGPWRWILCIFSRHCICYTTYQRPRPFNVPNRAQVTTCDSQIVSNHCPRCHPRYSCERNRLSGKTCFWVFFELAISCFRNMKRNTDDIGIFLSRLLFFPSFRFYSILFLWNFP